MKKLFIFSLTFLLLISLAGCRSTPASPTEPEAVPTTDTMPNTENTQPTETTQMPDVETFPTEPEAQPETTQPETTIDITRYSEYTGPWLNKETAEWYADPVTSTLYIYEIYSDCFIASIVNPPGGIYYEIKVNGHLSEEWCVYDAVECTYNNIYSDQESMRQEADLLEIVSGEFMFYKPVIYLYPETETNVSVQLQLDGKLTCTYPSYNAGWNVSAAPDGTLTDAKGQTYNYLYWEGETNAQWDMESGFCVKGEDTAPFLEDALAKLGLNRKEANEFIVFWLPMMEQNPYNIISFQTVAYTDAAQLQVSPAPDTLIRVFMAWSASDSFVELSEQELTAPERTGFTVIEWGGTEIP